MVATQNPIVIDGSASDPTFIDIASNNFTYIPQNNFLNISGIEVPDYLTTSIQDILKIIAIKEFARDMDKTDYQINLTKSSNPPQELTTTSNFNKRTIWEIMPGSELSHAISKATVSQIHDYFGYKISEVIDIDKSTKKILFIPADPPKSVGDIKQRDEESKKIFKELILALDIHKDKLEKLARKILFNVFTPQILKKILKEDKIEFIMGNSSNAFLYLKCGKTAYRT